MKNSELAKQAYEFELLVRETFEKSRVSPYCSFVSCALYRDGVDIKTYDYRYGGGYSTLYIPYLDLDNIDAFIVRQRNEIKKEDQQKMKEKYEKKGAL
jgi:hypothetical protein